MILGYFLGTQNRHGVWAVPAWMRDSALGLGGLLARGVRLGRGGASGLGDFGEGGETGGIVGGDVGEDLTVEGVAGELEAVDEGGVAHAVLESGGADADDPKRAILALLLLAAGVGELESALDGFLSGLVELGFGEEVAAGALEDLAAAIGLTRGI
jgi:hypothetical protein